MQLDESEHRTILVKLLSFSLYHRNILPRQTMKIPRLPVLNPLILAFLASSSLASEPIIPATRPTENTSHWVPARTREVKRQLKELPCDILFVGDSITECWEREGRQIWQSAFLPMKAVNFGISGDRTDNVLWRIKDTGLKTTTPPKCCIILLGTNNIGKWDAKQKTDDIVRGIESVCKAIRKKFPLTHLILMGVTPYGNDPAVPHRRQGDEINAKLAKLNLPYSDFLNLNDKMLNEDGTQKEGLFKDHVHLTAAGYQIWADALLPLLHKQK